MSPSLRQESSNLGADVEADVAALPSGAPLRWKSSSQAPISRGPLGGFKRSAVSCRPATQRPRASLSSPKWPASSTVRSSLPCKLFYSHFKDSARVGASPARHQVPCCSHKHYAVKLSASHIGGSQRTSIFPDLDSRMWEYLKICKSWTKFEAAGFLTIPDNVKRGL